MNLTKLSDEVLSGKLVALNVTREALYAKQEKLQEKLRTNFADFEEIKKEQMKRLVESSATTPWGALLDASYQSNTYGEIEKLVDSRFPGNMQITGYWTKTAQHVIQVRFDEKSTDKLEEIAAFLEEVLPYIKELEGGGKPIGLLDPSLSENGSYRLEINGTEHNLIITRWGQSSIVKSFDTLIELLQYMQDNFSFSYASYDE